MESESKLVTGTNSTTVDIRSGSGRSVDLGTSTPSLQVEILNEGPSNNVIIPARGVELRAGQKSIFNLGDLTSGSVITIQNNDVQPAKVRVSW